MAAAKERSFEDLREGLSASNRYEITPEVYHHFLSAFMDESPIHVDAHAAVSAGFAGLVMHGAILNGFLSHFVGMELPGSRSLLLNVALRYLKPCYMGDEILLEGSILQRTESQRVIVLDLKFIRLAGAQAGETAGRKTERVARGRAEVMVRPT